VYSQPKAYDRFMGRWSRRLAARFADFACPSGARLLLDVGTGTGSLSGILARALPEAEIVGVDPASEYLAYARRQMLSPRVRLIAADAATLPFRDGTFDASLAQLVLHGVPDPGKAMVEMRRVTRPGGRIAVCEWDFSAGMDLLRLLSDAVVQVEPEAEPRHARYTPLGGQGELRALLGRGGLADVEEASISIPLEFASFDDFWQPVLAGATPRTAHIAGLPPARKDAVREWLRQQLGDGPFTLHAGARAVRGSVVGARR
jgi:SAM-dependent methyltransferase